MSLIDAEFSKALGSGRVKRKRNNTKKFTSGKDVKNKASRVANGSPEVMVKITGFGKGSAHARAHLAYISRNAEVEIEDEKGNILSDKESVNKLFNKWEKDFSKEEDHKKRRDTMHMVMSMPEGTPSDDVRKAVREFAKQNFGKNHEYVMALHSPENDDRTKQPHVHLAVKMQGMDGKRLNPRKDDLQAWREDFAENLRKLGVDAEASPRTSRGVVKKAERNVIRHIEQGDKTHAPRVPKVKAAAIKEMAEEIKAEQQGKTPKAKPWVAAIESKQAQIKQSWLSAASYLEQKKPPITFNNKEQHNERPNYANAGTISRAAAIYQSNIEKIRRKAFAFTKSSLRNMPSSNVVFNKSATEVLLQQNAPNSLGRRGRTDNDLRRAGTGNISDAGSSRKRVDAGQGIAEQQKSLAERIRGFVAAMPVVETQAQRLKKELMQKFVKQKDLGAENVAKATGIKELVDVQQLTTKQKNRDIER